MSMVDTLLRPRQPRSTVSEHCLWVYDAGSPVNHEPVIGANGDVYIATADSRIIALDPFSGERKWEKQAEGSGTPLLSVGPDGAIFAGGPNGENGTVYRLNPSNGHIDWNQPTVGDIRVAPWAAPNQKLHVCTRSGAVYAFDPTHGTPIWEQQVGKKNGAGLYDRPILQDGRLFIKEPNVDSVHVRNPDTGEKMGRATPPVFPPPWREVTTPGGARFRNAMDSNTLFACDAATGRVLWRIETGEEVLHLPVEGRRGVFYLNSADKHVYALSDDAPALLRRLQHEDEWRRLDAGVEAKPPRPHPGSVEQEDGQVTIGNLTLSVRS